jgi:saccharopine dehydrogenase-like NADP-dependent oxidoreductase
MLSAIQIAAAAAMCTILDLLSSGVLPQHGFIRRQDLPLKIFLENRFGRVYAPVGQREFSSRLRDSRRS